MRRQNLIQNNNKNTPNMEVNITSKGQELNEKFTKLY